MMTCSGSVKVCLLAVALGGAVAGPAVAENRGNHGWENGDRGRHRGNHRHDHRYAEPRGYYRAPPLGYYGY